MGVNETTKNQRLVIRDFFSLCILCIKYYMFFIAIGKLYTIIIKVY